MSNCSLFYMMLEWLRIFLWWVKFLTSLCGIPAEPVYVFSFSAWTPYSSSSHCLPLSVCHAFPKSNLSFCPLAAIAKFPSPDHHPTNYLPVKLLPISRLPQGTWIGCAAFGCATYAAIIKQLQVVKVLFVNFDFIFSQVLGVNRDITVPFSMWIQPWQAV